ncbi:MAG: LysM peptidoglycan-binding domain-containing protein [Opitutaceae bacterium]
MKILKIFSMVLALHLVLLVVFLVSPGCQSRPTPVEDGPAEVPSTGANWSNQGGSTSSSLDPLPVGSGYANQPLLGQTPADRARATPTRPGAAGTQGSDAWPAERVLQPVADTPAEPTYSEPVLIAYSVKRGDSLWSISRQFGVSIQDIVAVNPGINPNAIQYGEKIMVPDGMSRRSPGDATGPAAAAPSLPEGSSTYTVKSGDYLARIASQNGTTVGAIRQANRLESDLIQVGQVLIIPAGSAARPGSGGGSAGLPADAVTVTVQPGDTIGEIARNYDVTVKELMAANQITDARKLRVGQKLVIPGFTSVDSTRTSVTVNPPASQAPAASSRTPPPSQAPEPALPDESDASPVIPVESQPASDLDELLPGDDLPAPVIPIDEPVPQP